MDEHLRSVTGKRSPETGRTQRFASRIRGASRVCIARLRKAWPRTTASGRVVDAKGNLEDRVELPGLCAIREVGRVHEMLFGCAVTTARGWRDALTRRARTAPLILQTDAAHPWLPRVMCHRIHEILARNCPCVGERPIVLCSQTGHAGRVPES